MGAVRGWTGCHGNARRCLAIAVASCVAVWLSTPAAQELLDRVMARVGNTAITLTDVQAAIGLGLVDVPAGEDPQAAALRQMIDRQLVLEEIARFPPPEPDAAAIAAQVETLKAAAGTRWPALMRTTGVDEARLRDLARDTLRIQAYLALRFGTSVQVSDLDVEEYFRSHPDEFTRNGVPMTFDEAQAQARERAAAERRQTTIGRWLADLRARSEVVEVGR